MSGDTEDDLDSKTSQHNVVGFDCGIFHPYVGTVLIDVIHPLLVMRDMGRSLRQAIRDPDFRFSWLSNQELRKKFLVEVGMSALNLVRNCKLCHNDIRVSNICVRNPTSEPPSEQAAKVDVESTSTPSELSVLETEADNVFCLIDFDMSRAFVHQGAADSRVLCGLQCCNKEMLMMYTVAQIALVVYVVDTVSKDGYDEFEGGGDGGLDTTDLRTFWLKDPELCSSLENSSRFDSWLSSRPVSVRDIFPLVPGTRSVLVTSMDWEYFVSLLKAAVGTECGPTP
jgi:hypothetical protein